jgi:AcrR family transcriptional regulator
MTIHHHVESKEGLLDGIAELLWEEVARPADPAEAVGALRALAHSVRDLFRRHPQAAPLILRSARLPRSELELFARYLDALGAAGVREPATVLRPIVSYAAGYGYAEQSMFGVRCEPDGTRAPSERELLVAVGQALPAGTPAELVSAAVAMIADCDPDRCFEEGLELMLAGLTTSPPGTSRTRRAHDPE